MKFKTAGLVVAVALFFGAILLFLQEPHNHQVLRSEFHFLAYRFSVMRALAVWGIMAAVLPSLYFTFKTARLFGHARGLEKDGHHRHKLGDHTRRLEELMAHEHMEKALASVEGKGEDFDPILKARVYLKAGQLEKAEALLANVDTVEAAYMRAEILIRWGGSPEPALRPLIDRHPEDALRAFRELLTYYDSLADWNSCASLMGTMKQYGLPRDEELAVAYRFAAAFHDPELTTRRKIEQVQKILKRAPDFVPANLALGDLYLENGSEEKAFRVYEQSFEATQNPVFLERLEAYYMERERPEDAIRIYRQLMVHAPTPLVKLQLGKLYLKLEMLDESLELLQPLRAELPELDALLLYLAEAKLRRDRLEDAIEDLGAVIMRHKLSGKDYHCGSCEQSYGAWQERCEACGSWGKIQGPRASLHLAEIASAPRYA